MLINDADDVSDLAKWAPSSFNKNCSENLFLPIVIKNRKTLTRTGTMVTRNFIYAFKIYKKKWHWLQLLKILFRHQINMGYLLGGKKRPTRVTSSKRQICCSKAVQETCYINAKQRPTYFLCCFKRAENAARYFDLILLLNLLFWSVLDTR